MLTKQQKFDLIDEKITEDVLADFMCADFGETLSIYEDGQVNINQYMLEIDPDERPFAQARCAGIGNIDDDYWFRDWTEYDEETGLYRVKEDGRMLTLEQCIRECCTDGDVLNDLEDLQKTLKENVEREEQEKKMFGKD